MQVAAFLLPYSVLHCSRFLAILTQKWKSYETRTQRRNTEVFPKLCITRDPLFQWSPPKIFFGYAATKISTGYGAEFTAGQRSEIVLNIEQFSIPTGTVFV